MIVIHLFTFISFTRVDFSRFLNFISFFHYVFSKECHHFLPVTNILNYVFEDIFSFYPLSKDSKRQYSYLAVIWDDSVILNIKRLDYHSFPQWTSYTKLHRRNRFATISLVNIHFHMREKQIRVMSRIF